MRQSKLITILIAEDDPDDRALAEDAFLESRIHNRVEFVSDGVEVLQYLRCEGKFADKLLYPEPGLVLLDLNMPRMDGREALAEIKADPKLRHFPVVVLTTSKSEDDIAQSYKSGANSFITKPATFESLVEMVRTLNQYWLEVVDLPKDNRGK